VIFGVENRSSIGGAGPTYRARDRRNQVRKKVIFGVENRSSIGGAGTTYRARDRRNQVRKKVIFRRRKRRSIEGKTVIIKRTGVSNIKRPWGTLKKYLTKT
jgi:hypothetical protein